MHFGGVEGSLELVARGGGWRVAREVEIQARDSKEEFTFVCLL